MTRNEHPYVNINMLASDAAMAAISETSIGYRIYARNSPVNVVFAGTLVSASWPAFDEISAFGVEAQETDSPYLLESTKLVAM
jgi:hypothetical protein